MRASASWPLIGDTRNAARWSASLFLVLAIYGAAIAVLLTWKVPVEPLSLPPAVVMMDLQPLPPPPAPVVTPPAPPEPIKLPEPLPKVEAPAVTLPIPIPKPKPQPRKPIEPQPEPPRIAPPTQEAPPLAAAPVTAPVIEAAPNPMPRFESLLVAHLERNKRYPRSSQIRREQGTVRLRFTMDRLGKVLQAQIDDSSGYSALDEEVLAMIRRAEPLPAFPPDMTQAQLELIVPIRFSLR
jgi:protein TonB